MKIHSIFIFAILLFPLVLTAQQEDFTKEEEFFQKQKDAYNKWLEESGIGSILSVKEIVVEPKSISLYLKFAETDIDYVVNAWEKLKATFDSDQSITLEQQLFYKAVHYMRVEQDQIDVQVYDTYDLSEPTVFMRAIYFSDGLVKVATNNPQSIIEDVSIPISRINSDGDTRAINGGFDKDYVFRQILKGAQTYYEAQDKKIDGRVPVFKPLGSIDNLRFEISDLTREVVTDASRGVFCPLIKLLGFDCNWSPREVLTFTITYKGVNDDAINLEIKLDGLVGSGVYAHAKRESYINLEAEHKPALKRYVNDKMLQMIYNWVTGRP